MNRLGLYMMRQQAPWLFVAIGGALLVFLATQLMRVSQVFIGAGAGLSEVLRALALLLVPTATWSLAPAFAISVFAVAGRMEEEGELVALDSSGINRIKVASGPVATALVLSIVSAWLWLDVCPRSQAALRSTAIDLAARALAGRIEPGVFAEPVRGVTFFAEARDGSSFDSILIEDARNRAKILQISASNGTMSVGADSKSLSIELSRGVVFMEPATRDDPAAALSFDRFDMRVPIDAELEQRLDFFPRSMSVPTLRLTAPPPAGFDSVEWSYALWRRAAGPVGFLAFSLLCVVLALGSRWRNRALAIGAAAAAFLAFHLAGRFGESLMNAGMMPAAVAAFLPAAIAAIALLALLTASAARRLS